MNAAKTTRTRAFPRTRARASGTVGGVFAWACAAFFFASLPLAGSAQAQQLDSVSREAASALAVAGLEAYEAGSYEEALDKLEKSYAVARVPTLALWSARTLHKLGRWLEAEDRYREAIGLPLPDGAGAAQQQALVDAQSELAQLTPTIPSLRIEVEGARLDQIELRVDGKPVSTSETVHRVDPGAHHIEGARGDARQAVDLKLSARDARTILLRFVPQPSVPLAATNDAAQGSWLRPAGWTALTLGGAGVAIGTVALVLAIQKKDAIDHDLSCHDNKCPTNKRNLVDSYNSRRTLSTVGFVTGGVLAAVGVSALVVGGNTPSDARTEAVVSPAFTGLRGSF